MTTNPLARRAPLLTLALLILLVWLGAAPSPAHARPEAPGRIAIVGAAVYVSPDAMPVQDAVILIAGDRIEKVGPRATTPVPAGYRIVDQSGRVVTAGFWNSHVHLTTPVFLGAETAADAALENELERSLTRWGFTTVFDLASTTPVALAVRNRIETGRVKGPRVLSVFEPFYPAGATPVYARPIYKAYNLPSAEVASASEAVRRVRRQSRDGADGFKVFVGSIVGGKQGVAHMPAETIAAVSRTARVLGKPVFAHPTDRAGLELSVNNGVDVLAHVAPVMGEWTPAYARWIASRGVALVPTLHLHEVSPDPSTPLSTAVQQVTAFDRAGGTVLFGTDVGFTEAFDTAPEIKLLSGALGWRGVLASLTTNPARTFGEAAARGRVAPGYKADLVLLGGDPAARVENLADVRMVFRDGRPVFTRTETSPGPR